ncbi:MAG: hypothetical protein WBA17_08430, partial [Saprospiraceae bacterium]
LPLYQPETAGCYDGLMESGMNRNQGAESLLAYLISRVVMEDFELDDEEDKDVKQQMEVITDPDLALRKMVNGMARKETAVKNSAG